MIPTTTVPTPIAIFLMSIVTFLFKKEFERYGRDNRDRRGKTIGVTGVTGVTP